MKNKFLIGLCGCLLVAGLSSCGPKKWKVTFDSNGGSEVTTQEVKDGAKATKPTDPTKDGCNFESWYTTEDLSGDAYNFDTAVKADLKLYAKWADKVVPTGFTFVDDVDDATINVGATGTAKIKLNSDVDASKVNIKWTIEDTTILEKVGNDNELEFKFKGLKATDLLGTKIAVSVTSKDIVSYHSEKGFNVFVETPATKVDVSKEQAYSYVTTYTLKLIPDMSL